MKHKFIIIISMLIVIGLYSSIFFFSFNKYDSSKSTEFFRVDSAKGYTGFDESFVVYNPPEDTLLLLKMVENYNLRTIPVSSLKKYERYSQTFYAKSEFLTRDFVSGARDTIPGSPYSYQELSAFSDDILIAIQFFKWNDGTYRYYRYFKHNIDGEKTEIIHDLDSFYHAKWIETADVDTTMVR